VDYRLNEFIRPRALITSGEICTNGLKKEIQAHMDVEMFNFYSSGEFGPIASECRAHEGLHLNADQLVLECCRNGRLVQTNESGFTVLTSLYAYTMPFIRYQLGDICTVTNRHCSCGSNLPLIEAPVGRQDEVIRMPNGKVVSVAAIVNITLRPFDGIDQFLLIQKGPYDFLLRVVFTQRPAEEILSEIRTRMVECLGKPASLDIQVVDCIKWDRGSKYKMFVSEIPQSDS
jgi:phenylacetate-CoA ligase